MFRTELPLTPHPQQLPPTARVLTIGSCFSDSIGNRLSDYKVATLVNPFGTVFNPISACKLLRAAAGEDTDWQQHVVEARGRWQSYDLHATLGADSPVELLQHIQRLVRDTGVFLATADAVVLTLGTAFAYRLQDTQEIISNCHKLPADKFEKELLSADEIIAAVAETHAYLRRINPRLRFILTVSPVRHLKETLALNSVSKSMLRVACHYLSELLPDVSYFPAYELLLDDLRDYRFYAADLLHPSDVAENYIWERFTRTYFDTAFGRFKKEWESIRQALNHRPLYIAAPEHRQFLEGTLARLQRLSTQADVRMELLHIEKELATLPLPPPPPLPEPDEDEDEDFLEEEASEIDEADDSRAKLLSQGSGLLTEADDEEYEQQEELTASPEVAYESAYSGEELEYADEEDLLTEQTSSIDGESDQELPVRKKKRRSRGGAKRSKRKAARLAAEAESSGVDPATEITAVGHSTPDPDEHGAENVEDVSTTEGITYISEAELFGTVSKLPSEGIATPAVQAEPQSVSVSAPEIIRADEDAPGSSVQEPRRRNRPERQPRQQGNRDPRRGNRQPLYAVPATEEVAAMPTETPPTGLEAPLVQPATELSDPTVASAPAATPPAAKSRSRSRGGAGRNRGNAGKDRVAQAAESAVAVGSVSATPVVEAQPIATPVAPTPVLLEPAVPVVAKARPKRAPRKAAVQPTPESPVIPPTEVLPVAPDENTGAAPKKRPARKATPKATEATAPAAPADAPVPAPKKAPSRKKAAPAAPAAEAEPAAAKAAPAPRRARPPRRKPATDSSSEETT